MKLHKNTKVWATIHLNRKELCGIKKKQKTQKQRTENNKSNEHKNQSNIKVLEYKSIVRKRKTNNDFEFVFHFPSDSGQKVCHSDSLNTPWMYYYWAHLLKKELLVNHTWNQVCYFIFHIDMDFNVSFLLHLVAIMFLENDFYIYDMILNFM